MKLRLKEYLPLKDLVEALLSIAHP